MLKLSKRVEYGLISLLHMATHSQTTPLAARELAALYHMPAEILGKVLQKLVKEGLLVSVQGASGGYRMLRPIEDIKFGEVLEALDGPFQIIRCDENPTRCEQYPMCNIREPALLIQKYLLDYIYSIPLAVFTTTVDPACASIDAELALGT